MSGSPWLGSSNGPVNFGPKTIASFPWVVGQWSAPLWGSLHQPVDTRRAARTGSCSCPAIWLRGWTALFYTRARAQAIFLLLQLKSYTHTHSRGNGATKRMLSPLRALWQLNSCFLPAVRRTTVVYFVTVMSVVEDVEKLIRGVERWPPLYTKM